ncbi:hypothetical protein Raf01_50350 [Rugosimonospora africana]|uniref:Uncharacterized protein n=1 Tax=Rugosimonospora africana TaxID=556532 RepID=A0A8J3QU40_9ACTN|nr:hypothetical protein Raf01_50350 [Rugosimonospora africana]
MLATTSLSGCRAGSTTPPGDAAVLDLVTRTGSYSQRAQILTDAENHLIADCMHAQHLPYVIPPAASPTTTPGSANDLASRSRIGYGLYQQYASKTPDGGPAAQPGSNDYYLAHLPEPEQRRYRTALRGDDTDRAGLKLGTGQQIAYPRHGCEPQARQRLYGDLVVDAQITYIPQNVNQAATVQQQQDSRYRAVLAQWSDCMATGGQRYATPADVRARLDARYRADGPSDALRQQEINLAVQDARCADRVHLDATALKILRADTRHIPPADWRELQRLTAAWLKAVTIAQRVAAR